MATSNNNNSDTTDDHQDLVYKLQYGYFDLVDKIKIDRESNDNDKNELMEDIYYEIIHTMENEIHENVPEPLENRSGDMDDRDESQTSVILKPLEEQSLSQKLSQLSTTITDKKQFNMKEIEDGIMNIPDYLTKQNQSFRQILHQALLTITTATSNNNNNNIEALRHIAILIYKIMFLQAYHSLWTIYLKSGTGQLIIPLEEPFIYPMKVSVWPIEMQTMIQSTTMNEIIENEICMTFVSNQLYQLDNQLKQYQMEMNMKVNHFNGYTLTIQQIMETYIEEHLSSLRMEIEHKIKLVHYDYHIRALKLEYLRHQPNEYQKQLMKQLCQERYEQEITEQAYDLLKEQITYYNSSSQSFESSSSIVHSQLIDSIQNSDIRQQVFQQYKQIAEESKAKLFNLYMKSAENERNQCKQKFDVDIKKMWTDRHSSVDNEKIPMIMIQLINQRCNKIGERIQCIYKFKHQCFLSTLKT